MRQPDRESYLNKRAVSGKASADDLKKVHEVRKILRESRVSTVCEKAKCPNINDCFSRSAATFIILGKACTRSCAFCSVNAAPKDTKRPRGADEDEPGNIARAVRRLKLKHVVITSVTRDDLEDKGISHFARTVRAISGSSGRNSTGKSDTSIELLTPDFRGAQDNIEELLDEEISVFGHNLEMVKRLYSRLRRGADYEASLGLLRQVKKTRKDIKTKSAVMLGLGEAREEVLDLLKDLRETGCDIVVIGQYLRPTEKNVPVQRYVPAEEFEYYREFALSIGFSEVNSFPRARSSYYPVM